MAGKRLLPRFGGGAGVWTACLLFFQAMLLAGYAYAHVARRFARRPLTFPMVAAVLTLPFFLRDGVWNLTVFGDPALSILAVLTVGVGLPFLLLAATGPLVQSWAAASGERSPYRLYALSNVASFLALLAYPVLIEPWMPVRVQSWLWAVIFVGFVAVMASLMPVEAESREEAVRPSVQDVLYWTVLATCGSVLLMAVTNHMCQEVAVIPFLWIVPLALYLLTFVISFGSFGGNRLVLGAATTAAVVLVPLACWMMTLESPRPYWQELAVDAAVLFAGCMICHGELARSRPVLRQLTWFYLCIAMGGALGGVFVAVVAPRVFNDYREYPLAMAACMLVGGAAWIGDSLPGRGRSGGYLLAGGERGSDLLAGGQPRRAAWRWTAGAMTAAVALAALTASVKLRGSGEGGSLASRSFYGVLRVRDYRNGPLPTRVLFHGRTVHGTQILNPVLKHWATTYYTVASAIGLAFEYHPARLQRPLKVGVVGLGAGTIAALGKPGDEIRFYEINPDVIRIARESFSYVADSYAKVDVVEGDARLRLEQESAGDYDILAVDAFNSDAIPTHLLTVEAAHLYQRQLKADGLLLFHIANKSIDLAPVTRALAAELHWRAQPFSAALGADAPRDQWVVLTQDENFLRNPAVILGMDDWHGDTKKIRWRDDFTSLWHVLKF